MTVAIKEKISLKDFIGKTNWESRDKAYWKQLSKGTHNWWDSEHQYWMFEEKEAEVWEALKQFKYVPYYKDGKLHLSQAMTIHKLIKRLRYVMRGNRIPNLGLDFNEMEQKGFYSSLHIGDKEFIRIIDCKSNTLVESI